MYNKMEEMNMSFQEKEAEIIRLNMNLADERAKHQKSSYS
jgi:hypothetical protein